MAISEYVTGTNTITTTEHSLVNDSASLATDTTAGVYQVFIDTSTMASGDQYKITVYEKVLSGGSQLVIYEAILTGTMAATWVSPSLVLLNGWDVSLTKLAGTNRSMSWSLRQVA